jgi:hypothetical protein
LDLFLDLTALIEQGNMLAHTPAHTRLLTTIELLNKCWTLDHQMEQFYESLKSGNPDPLFWSVMSSDSDRLKDDSHILAFTYFEFCSARVSVNLILYWASLTVLWSGMTRLYDSLEKLASHYYPSLASSPEKKELYEVLGVPDRGHTQNFIATARKVCFSVAFGLRDEQGMHTIIAPLMMICHALRPWKRYSEEITWVESKLEEIQGKGIKILKYSKTTTPP